MQTILVREAAAALGITPRAVTYRLDKGQLKGTLTKNDFGVPEWRVYPNKEVLKGLNEAESGEKDGQRDFAPGEVVDAVSIEASEIENSSESGEQRTYGSEFQAIVEQCVRPLVEEVKAQAIALAEKDRIIEDQGRQLRLLPDLQKQSEEERKAAELKALEVEALQKQITAMEERRRDAETEAEKAESEKEAKEKAIGEELIALRKKLEKLEQPWWKKWFAAGE